MSKEQDLLEQYTHYYQDQLEKIIGRRVSELDPIYKRLQVKAVEYLEQLNKELAEASDAVRASRRYRVKMQEAYVAKLLPDLQLLEAAQQPYYTEVLAGTLEYGYYTSAYTLEKAAKVVSTVRILDRSGVLGMLANPWLPDRHTYSDRIRANTQLIADKTLETVEDLVTKRLNYSEAAKELSSKIGESYYNATRLIRTEMKRANSLGSSYAAMDNADILEGKYWDATLDGKTAPRCAKNDRELFDLDYDTPINPGVPGKRIPNHPHCRCGYVNKLRYIDPISKRKAKGKDGKDYVTVAKTYDDYAKERGLPSVNEMLEKDNPRRYLRPGETVDSIKQKVVRKEFSGHTITASRAPWDTDTVTNGAKGGILKKERPIVDNTNLQGMYGKKHATAMGGIVEKAPDSVRNTWVTFQNEIKSYDTKYRGSDAHYSRAKDGVKMSMAKSAKGSNYEAPYQVAFHEFGHNIDYEMNMRYGTKERFKTISETYKDGLLGKSVKQEANNYVAGYITKHYDELRSMLPQADIDSITSRAESALRRSLITQSEKQGFIDKAIRDAIDGLAMTQISNDLRQELTLLERGDISDIFEGATGAKIRLGVGHGAKYWVNRDNGKEVFAEMFSATMCNEDSLKQIKRFFPESYKIFLEIMELVK